MLYMQSSLGQENSFVGQDLSGSTRSHATAHFLPVLQLGTALAVILITYYKLSHLSNFKVDGQNRTYTSSGYESILCLPLTPGFMPSICCCMVIWEKVPPSVCQASAALYTEDVGWQQDDCAILYIRLTLPQSLGGVP